MMYWSHKLHMQDQMNPPLLKYQHLHLYAQYCHNYRNYFIQKLIFIQKFDVAIYCSYHHDKIYN